MTDGACSCVSSPTGAKSWVQRLTVFGRRRELGLGSFHYVTLAEAREAAFENLRVARRGRRSDRGARPPSPDLRRSGRNRHRHPARRVEARSKNEATWRSTLADYAFLGLGRMPVDKIGGARRARLHLALWSDKRATGQRVRSRIRAVLNWAVAEGHRPDNPAGESISAALPVAALRWPAAQRYPMKMCQRAGRHQGRSRALPAALALEWIALTACRSVGGEVGTMGRDRSGRRYLDDPGQSHEDRKRARCPAVRPGAGDPERRRRDPADRRPAVPADPRQGDQRRTLSKIMRDLKIPAVPHGFRSTFRTWAAERTNVPKDVAEAALAHTVSNGVEAAYNRAVHFDARRDLMAAWARYLAGDAVAAVLPLKISS